MSIKREYDILVYGATGFTGKLVAEYLVTNAPSSVKLAIGGRSLSKLKGVAAELAPSSALGILVADSFDLKALEDMVSKTRIVISTVGPFAKYGETLVQACVSKSTNYIDSTGEPDFIRRLIDNYHAEAFKKNIKIVPSCGFDSLPSDLGTFLIANHFKKLNAQTTTVEAVFLDVSGGISGGTIATMCHYIQNSSYEDLQKLASDGDYLAPDSHPKHRVHTRTSFHYSKSIGKWVTPFMMEAANLRYVRRSASLLKYGPNFQYSEGTSASNSLLIRKCSVWGTHYGCVSFCDAHGFDKAFTHLTSMVPTTWNWPLKICPR